MKKLFPFIIPTLLLCGCTRLVNITQTDDFTREFYTPSHATGFALRSLPDDTTALMLEVYRPDTMRIAIPRGGFSSILCMSSTYVGHLCAADAGERIVAVSGKNYITDSLVRSRAVDVGYEGAMDYESLLAAKPDIALIYGIGGESALAAKLAELDVPYVYVGDFEEQDPLGRAEWTVALGALAGQDARRRFDDVCRAYSPSTESNVPVMINAPYSGSWFIPGKDVYMSRLIADAGGRLAAPQPEGVESKPADMEVVIPALEQADIWLNPGQVENVADLKRLVPKADFHGHVWNQKPDFYESGAANPHRVLAELKLIFSGCDADTLHYFHKVK